MILTSDERARIRYHLGFPELGLQPVLALGFPSGGHPAFLVERSMDHVLPEAIPKLREVLQECECVEAQLRETRSQRLKVSQVGSTRIRAREELEDLRDLYAYWTDRLADMLAVVKNPFSLAHQGAGGVTVVGP